jgi:hypothetical protein
MGATNFSDPAANAPDAAAYQKGKGKAEHEDVNMGEEEDEDSSESEEDEMVALSFDDTNTVNCY